MLLTNLCMHNYEELDTLCKTAQSAAKKDTISPNYFFLKPLSPNPINSRKDRKVY